MASTGDWMARAQRRRNAELRLLRRPSETGSQSTAASDRHDTMSPSSPESSHSAQTTSSFDQLHALQTQLRSNTAQIEANEARMREIEDGDNRMGADIQDRLSAVMELNKRLNILRDVLARADRVSKGEFGKDQSY
ncbi:hypothetical protein DOTSEDRAFT_33859 [Dothistroma septosporum NZE10]|uniref:Uncharacterized protein n=1 Tax=Dothistroma septosporum (strain NZE10 / CBS 128990) TaxID=675120 RepID=N1PSD0_DOTSN|nr:hypothetical protein DOTSEDRAFT_33859 [Dothistroma septosporum NZE10]